MVLFFLSSMDIEIMWPGLSQKFPALNLQILVNLVHTEVYQLQITKFVNKNFIIHNYHRYQYTEDDFWFKF